MWVGHKEIRDLHLIQTNETTHMTIKDNGKVGIGTRRTKSKTRCNS